MVEYGGSQLDSGSNEHRLEKAMCRYDLCKYNFANTIVNIWISVSNHVVLAKFTNSLKSCLHKY